MTGIVDRIRELLQDIYSTTSSTVVVCLGIDGKVLLEEGLKNRYDANQIGIAISKDGLIAYAKKFHPTDDIESQVVDLASDYLSTEKVGNTQYGRIFQVGGKSFYLAECNDIKGLQNYPKPESVDCVLNCVHGCYNRNDGPTCSYFVRLNFAGASRHWKCPVFGAVVFFKRKIAEKWRTGMLYRRWDRDPINCDTDENALAPILTDSSYLLGEGDAQVDVYDLDVIFKGRPVYREHSQRGHPLPPHDAIPRATRVKSELPTTGSILYERLRKELDPLFGKSVIDQTTKFTYRGKNQIGFPKKAELDMISLFKPTQNARSVKFRIYPYVLGGHLGRKDVDTMYDALPSGTVLKQERDIPNPGEIYFKGSFSDVREIERYIEWILKSGD